MRCLVVLLLVCSPSLYVQAHSPMEHDCIAPIRPNDDHNDVLWKSFKREIDSFRNCVHQKMQWHQDNARQHNQAAADVVEAWNSFVHGSLNAPEDFPWPPPAEKEAPD